MGNGKWGLKAFIERKSVKGGGYLAGSNANHDVGTEVIKNSLNFIT